MHTNEQFIKALNRKKEEAFQMLFKDYYASLVMYAMHYVRQEVAEDIVQDLMTLLWEKDTYFDSISAFHSFIYLFIRNRSINHLKHQKAELNYINYRQGESISDESEVFQVMEEENTVFSSTSSTNCRNAVRKYSNYTWPGKKKMKLPHNSAFPSQRLKAKNRRHFNV